MNPETCGAIITRRCRVVFRSIALLLGATQLVLARNGFGPDSRSYSEIARAYLRHDWTMAINAYWSPLYPWLIALTLQLGKPALSREFPLLHLLNFFIFIVALAGFEFFWTGLLTAEALNRVPSRREGPISLPTSALWILGYALFIWLTVGSLIGVLGADLGVATVALFVAGLLVRIKASSAVTTRKSLYIWLGVALGLGYLTKAVMFPMALVFLGVTLFLRLNWRNVANVGLALLIFASIAVPQIIALSRVKGRVTFSDSGKLTFAWSNYGLPICDWQGQPAGSGIPLHPTRMVYAHPQMFEFNGPIRASYPPWYDPSYWNDGMSPKFKIDIVFRHFVRNATSILLDFTGPRIWLVGVILLLLLCDPSATVRCVFRYWYLIVPSVSVFAAYSLTFAEFRYMPAWLLMVWASMLAGLRLRPGLASPPIAMSVAISVAAVMMASMAYGFYGQSKSVRHDDATKQYSIAEGLTKLGVLRGDKVGAVGFDNDAHWAYLDGLMVVAEIHTDAVCTFWHLSASDKSAVLHRFAQAGARAIIANADHHFRSTSRDVPFDFAACSSPDAGWRRIGDTEDYVYFSQDGVREAAVAEKNE
jgi:hypothetical protein